MDTSGADHGKFKAMLHYMSIQKIRTPKGLANLAVITRNNRQNDVLIQMQMLQQIYCAIWTECVWSIADASKSTTKFILSDHPITVYNEGCCPESELCRDDNDPDIRRTGTHTIFPLKPGQNFNSDEPVMCAKSV